MGGPYNLPLDFQRIALQNRYCTYREEQAPFAQRLVLPIRADHLFLSLTFANTDAFASLMPSEAP